MKFAEQNALLEPLCGELVQSQEVSLWVKRDDLLHPIVSGNKWRKLCGLLPIIANSGAKVLLSMGGSWSNFQHSASFVCRQLGLRHIALTRFHPGQALTPTMKDMLRWGSHIEPVSRLAFQAFRSVPSGSYSGQSWLARLAEPAQNAAETSLLLEPDEPIYWLSEGADDAAAMSGFESLVASLEPKIDYLICASATGISVAGLALACMRHNRRTRVLGISVLNNRQAQCERVMSLLAQAESLLQRKANWAILDSPVSGGFAKKSTQVEHFVRDFNRQQSPLNNHTHMAVRTGPGLADQDIPHQDIPHQDITGLDVTNRASTEQTAKDQAARKQAAKNQASIAQGYPICQIEPVYTGRSFLALQCLLEANYFPRGSRIIVIHCGGMQGARGSSDRAFC